MKIALAANLSLMYAHLPWCERASAAASDGFSHAEVQFPYESTPNQWKHWLSESGVQLALMNAPPGDWERGDRGLAAIHGREAEFEASIELALAYCASTGCERVHVMSGNALASDSNARSTWVRNMKAACSAALKSGITLLVEPLNSRDFPGYFVSRQDEAIALIDATGCKNLLLQFDFYHLQVMEGDLLRHWNAHRDRVGHVQIAGAPGRNEPDTGEIAYQAVFDALVDCQWTLPVGCEYKPRHPTPEGVSAGLQWRDRFGLA
jgi:hydroxypyruvate isomerase